MATNKQKITPFLWFDDRAEEAAKFYTSLFKDSKIGSMTRYAEEAAEVSGRPKGSVMTVAFELAGQKFTALNGGPQFKFNPSISFFVILENETEVDKLWQELEAGGMVLMPLQKYDWSEKYGWVQDRFGLPWQVSLGRKDGLTRNYDRKMFDRKKEIQTLEAVSAAWERAMVSNDAEAIGRFMADDWVIVSERGVTKKKDFLAVVACGDLTHETFRGEIISVRKHGDAAVLTARVRNNGHYKGQPFSFDEWTTDVFVKRNGTWVCVHSHITSVKEA